METYDTAAILNILASQKDQVITKSPSPVMVWLAPIVRDVSETSLAFEYMVRKDMTNLAGMLHGGIAAAIMDDQIGATVICSGRDHLYTTINNVIDYFAPARLGEKLLGKTSIVKAGKRVINVQFELFGKDSNKLIARGHSNMLETDVSLADMIYHSMND